MTDQILTATAVRRPGRDAVVPLGLSRWRILTPGGAVAGLVEEQSTDQGVRYRALRYRWSARCFQDVGGFWSFADAVATLRNG